jgi:YqaJ-like viral recombinase domain
MCLPAKDMGGRRLKPRFPSNYLKDGSFFKEAMTFISNLGPPGSIIQSQVKLTAHDLCIFRLAYEFARLPGVGKEYEGFIKFAERAFRKVDLKTVKRQTLGQSSSPLWKTLRFCRTSASRLNEASCAGVTGEPREALLRKFFGATQFKPTEAMQRGLTIEDAVRAAFAKKMNCKIGVGYLQLCMDHPLMAATPDGVAKEFIVEIKSPQKNQNSKSYLRQDGVPTKKVLLQMMLQMRFCEKDHGYLVIADEDFEVNGKLSSVVKVLYKDHVALLEDSIKNAEIFWKDVVFLRLMKTMRPVLI